MEKQRRDELLMRQIGERLKYFRTRGGFSQEFVEERTKLNVSKLEMGKTNISATALAILCTFYDVTLSEFYKDIEISDPIKELKGKG